MKSFTMSQIQSMIDEGKTILVLKIMYLMLVIF